MYGRGPIAFNTEWVKNSLGEIVMKAIKETHPCAKFTKISSNLSAVDVSGSRTKRRVPSKQLVHFD